MGKLIYVTNMSLDGFIEDADGNFNLYEPSDEVFAACTELVSQVGTFLFGRRLYETMSVWETDPTLGAQSDLAARFATAWQAADKVVYSSTLTSPTTAKTSIERDFDSDAVRELKASSTRDLHIGGAHLSGQAFDVGLIDEVQLFVWPSALGGGKPAFRAGVRLDLQLISRQTYRNGVVQLNYRVQAI